MKTFCIKENSEIEDQIDNLLLKKRINFNAGQSHEWLGGYKEYFTEYKLYVGDTQFCKITDLIEKKFPNIDVYIF